MLSRITALLVFPALLLSACTSTPGPKGDTGATGPAGMTGAPGPGFTGTVFSDWRAATPNGGAQFSSDKVCGVFGSLDNIKELSEARYSGGIVLVYAQSVNPLFPAQLVLPGQLNVGTSVSDVSFNSTSVALTVSIKSPSFATISDCPKSAPYFFGYRFRYVLIPVPVATPGAALSLLGLHSNLEKARAWYGLNDLSYASVASRFALHD